MKSHGVTRAGSSPAGVEFFIYMIIFIYIIIKNLFSIIYKVKHINAVYFFFNKIILFLTYLYSYDEKYFLKTNIDAFLLILYLIISFFK